MTNQQKRYNVRQHDAMYGFGFFGALVYFLQHATNFWKEVPGFLKALVWPAVLVYKLFEFLYR